MCWVQLVTSGNAQFANEVHFFIVEKTGGGSFGVYPNEEAAGDNAQGLQLWLVNTAVTGFDVTTSSD